VPPDTVDGLRNSPVNSAGVIVRVALFGVPFNVAVIADVVCELTPIVETVNVAELLPAGTITDAGTVAALFPLCNATTVPPEPAGPDSVTVPVEAPPPRTEVGLRASEVRAAGVIVSVADCG